MTQMDVFIRREGRRDVEHRRIGAGARAGEFKRELADGSPGWFLFYEDGEEQLEDDHELRGQHGGVFLHLTRCRKVDVTVRYAGRSITRGFPPSATLARIKRWAERKLELDAADAAELSLQLSGSDERPEESTHVGSLVTCPDCTVDFDLLPTDRINGAAT